MKQEQATDENSGRTPDIIIASTSPSNYLEATFFSLSLQAAGAGAAHRLASAPEGPTAQH